MRTKLGTALDIFILVIGPWIVYSRIIEMMQSGVSVYPMISVVIVTVAVIFSIYNLYLLAVRRQQNNMKK
ncbi:MULTISPECIES: hypothetical protein [Planococcus]|uniref:Uncharacterized protein n=2 Tax=Planococcus TaxID=1372 RepID=A0ABM5WW38_9BACL|nr:MULTISPECIES: hypothetical protein [Planococcus]ALS78558.1 hypothetical protein AUO94_07735 [Planococcus kocurii]AQU79459.1 hypothetical protein AJGP001_09390 [Planococcus faecalis]KAA0956432.1 hypothetical protein FQ085_13085 [Planococcus sp. ANT_H30]MDJ0332538.1 hypothetical protein [Planococcus sp. S3-L1]OHX51427.1 hypothetical protein BB777_03975 [Planococcus faecalis]